MWRLRRLQHQHRLRFGASNLVSALAEVNLVNLERVGFNLRNFDMVFIWKVRDVGRAQVGRLFPARARCRARRTTCNLPRRCRTWAGMSAASTPFSQSPSTPSRTGWGPWSSSFTSPRST